LPAAGATQATAPITVTLEHIMSTLKNIIITIVAISFYGLSNAQNNKLLVKNNSLFMATESDTILILANVDQIGVTHNRTTPFVRNSNIGLLDSSFNIVLEPKYHLCGSELEFKEGLLKVSNGDRGIVYIDYSGKEIITLDNLCSCCFENNWATSFSNGYIISYNGNWHVTDRVNLTLEITSSETFSSQTLQEHFHKSNSLGVVLFKTSDNLYGLILNGNVCVPPIYSEITLYNSDSPGIWADCKNINNKREGSYYIDVLRNTITNYKIE
jgi:hypothetical protein